MPCLKHGDVIITESSTIAEYINNTFPEPRLVPVSQDAADQVRGIFPALAKFVKKIEFDPDLEEGLLKELEKLEMWLTKTSGDLLLQWFQIMPFKL